MPFVHLHNHSEYSLLDGLTKINAMVDKAKADNQEYVALTDHGNMFGAIEFYKTCIKHGIKPIIGFESYVAEDRFAKDKENKQMFHLTLLAKNNTGYQNLLKLSTLSYTEGFYYKPRIDKNLLRQYSEGIIAGSACLHGEINYYLLNDNYDLAKRACLEYQEIFGKDNFFLEIMRHDLDDQKRIEKNLIKLANELNIPLVATNDSHYLNKQDAEAHDILLCVQTGHYLDDKDRMRMQTQEFYFKTQAEMYEKFTDLKESVDNSYEIARQCSIEIELGKLIYPIYSDSIENDVEKLDKITREGFKNRLANIKPDLVDVYKNRLEYELDVIKKMNFAGYFLIVWDFINYAKSHLIPVGPGRGSAAGSLVSYCLGITDVDPIRHNLLFERFLNPDRISMPDIDIDFCIEKRNDVIKYVADKYGQYNVAQVGTFGTLGAKNALKDVGRVLRIPFDTMNSITKLIPDSDITIQESIERSDELKRIAEQDKYKQLFYTAQLLEGNKRNFSVHAAGIVISKEPIYNTCPLCKTTKDTDLPIAVTQFEKDTVEQTGLIKFDFLGLKNLTVVNETLDLIKQNERYFTDYSNNQEKFDLNNYNYLPSVLTNLNLDDLNIYKMLSNGEVIGVFQLESNGMKRLLEGLQPTCFDDLVAVLALYRPGPLGSGMVQEFIDRKHAKTEIKYLLPQLEPILKDTYGIIVYQEQVMQIANVLAGYSMSEADVLRKIMGKKQIEKIANERVKFINRCVANGIKQGIAEDIFSQMEKFAEYGFNKSHSTAYAYISFQTAYLKYYYPVYFMCALLNGDISDSDQIQKYVGECRRINIDILPPNINSSKGKFSINNQQAIEFGLLAVKKVGEIAIDLIVDERNKQPFKSFSDFLSRINKSKVNSGIVENLIKAGCFDELDSNRVYLIKYLEAYNKCRKNKAVNKSKKKTKNIEKEKNDNYLFTIVQEDASDTDNSGVDNANETNENDLVDINCDKTAEAELLNAKDIHTTVSNKIEFEKEILGVQLTNCAFDVLKKYQILRYYNPIMQSYGIAKNNTVVKKITALFDGVDVITTKQNKIIYKVKFLNNSGNFEVMVYDAKALNIILDKSNLVDKNYKLDNGKLPELNYSKVAPVKIACSVKNINGKETYVFDKSNEIMSWFEIVNNLKKTDLYITLNCIDVDETEIKQILENIKNLIESNSCEEHIVKKSLVYFKMQHKKDLFHTIKTTTYACINNWLIEKLTTISDRVSIRFL